jgi:hypothetical protein
MYLKRKRGRTSSKGRTCKVLPAVRSSVLAMMSFELLVFFLLNDFRLSRRPPRSATPHPVLVVPCHNPSSGAALIDCDGRHFANFALARLQRENAQSCAQNRTENPSECCKLLHDRFSPMLGGGLEPPRLAAYAPQTYVSAISPPERFRGEGQYRERVAPQVLLYRCTVCRCRLGNCGFCVTRRWTVNR